MNDMMTADSQLVATKTEGGAASLILGNSRIRRVWGWNGGRIVTRKIEDLSRGLAVETDSSESDVSIPGLTDGKLLSSSFEARQQGATNLLPRHVEAVVETVFDKGSLRQVFRVFEDAPALEMTLWMKTESVLPSAQAGEGIGNSAIENKKLLDAVAPSWPVLDRIPLEGVHWTAVSVEFRDATDHCNNLVEEHKVLAYRRDTNLCGNVLFLSPLKTASPDLFVVKEAPCGKAQLDWQGHDFMVKAGRAEVRGCGFTNERLDGWVRGYGCAVGVSGRTEVERLTALRTYQKCLRVMNPKRDDMVLMNTWGDRGQDGRLCERFAMREIMAARELGVTHLQLDDGWQKGLSHNSAFAGGEFPDLARMPDFWAPHPARFPNGLAPIVDFGRKHGIEVCLWFNPSSANDYASWRQDADVMISLYRQYGITVFKIDGVTVDSKLGETRLRKMFDAVVEASGGDVVFNLDVTAGRRFGYHYFCEYGNVFMENRYTDWSNWYPTWTFRNIWQLAKYVPPERIQIEFLNNARNIDKYGADDELAPAKVPFDTALAITLAAQPLAWFEGTGLRHDAFFNKAKRLLATYREFSAAFHAGTVFPIGDEPSGRSFSGFQSIDENGNGWIILVREASDACRVGVHVYLEPGSCLFMKPLCGRGKGRTRRVDPNGCIELSLPARWSYEVWVVSR